MRNHINNNIKHREIYRPFAPAVLENLSLKYFYVKESPFMLRVTNCKKKILFRLQFMLMEQLDFKL